MNFFEKNLKSIEINKPYLYQKLTNKLEKTTLSQIVVESIITKDNNYALCIKNKSNETIRLNSLYSPLKEAKKWTEQFVFNKLEIVAVMFGMGNAIFPNMLLNKLKTNDVLLIYEPSWDIFIHVLKNYDLTTLIENQNVSLTIEGVNDFEFKNLLDNYVNWMHLKSELIFIHPQYDDIFKKSYLIFRTYLADNKKLALVARNSIITLGKSSIDNTIKNLSNLKRINLIKDLEGIIEKSVPAVIVAAGPSLDKNVESLKVAKGKAIIFAVDTAVKYLLAKDIIPDFIVTLDPRKSSIHLQNDKCKEIPIFCRIDSQFEYYKNGQRVFLYGLDGYAKEIFSRLGIETEDLNAGGSVATGAFSICVTLGFKRIIFVGQDLAYSGAYTHAGGLVINHNGIENFKEIVEDIYGNPIKTRYDWYLYIKWFEDAIESVKDIEVIDATEGGAKIKGTTIMTLKETIDRYCIKDVVIAGVLEKLPSTLSEEGYQNFKNFVSSDLHELVEMKKKAIEAGAISEKLVEKYKKNPAETTSSTIKSGQLSKLNQEMEEMRIYRLVDVDISAATVEHLSDIYSYTDDEQKDKITTYEKAKLVYSAIQKSVDRLVPLIEELIKVIE